MKKILVITGEESGDKQFSLFWKEISPFLKKDYKLWGIGGSFFTSSGGEVVFPQEKLSVMGVTEVVSKIKNVFEAGKKILNHPYLSETLGVILVDFPDFNFRVGKLLSKRGFPVVYFIPPKVWAWRKSRIYDMKRFVDLALLIFPFEVELYNSAGIENLYVGNPSVRYLKNRLTKNMVRDSVLLLPGSRNFEVERLLPVMLKSVKILHLHGYALRKKLILAKSVDVKRIVSILTEAKICNGVEVIGEDKMEEAFSTSKIAIAASGSINLELAVAEVPQIVVYRVSPLTFAIGKKFVKLDYVSPVNIVAGKMVVPELLQDDCREDKIVKKIFSFLDNDEEIKRVQTDYNRVVEELSSDADLEFIARKVESVFEKKKA